MRRICAIVQARVDSSRLPGKILKPLPGGTILEHILRRLLTSRRLDKVLVATTEDSLPFLAPLCSRIEVELLAGPNEDVLSRFILANRRLRADVVVRATADNPLVSVEFLDTAVDHHIRLGGDLTYYRDLPLGCGVEVVEAEALEVADIEGRLPRHREHVTTYIRENPSSFRIRELRAPFPYRRPELRLTVDTPEDLALIELIYNNLYRGRLLSLAEVINFLDRNKNLREINFSYRLV